MVFQHKLIESLNRHSANIAIRYEDRQITYSQLSDISGKISRFLSATLPDTLIPVGILSTDRAAIIPAVIGICNARCIFVPLDPTWPSKRLERMFADLDLKYIISSGSNTQLEQTINDAGITTFFITDILKASPAEVAHTISYQDDDSLYVYFTSGTTGMPKGIVGKNDSLLQFLMWEIDEFGFNEPLRYSQLISPYFDAFLRDIFIPLLTGGTICIPAYDGATFPVEQLSDWVNSAGIHVIHCVPSVFRSINTSGLTADDYPALKYVLMSGEKIIPGELKNWQEVFNARIQLVNLYGATETTMIRSFYRIMAGDAEKARIPIGTPIRDTEILILNADFKPCVTLIPGDLYIVSRYMSKGYLNNPELTNSRFFSIHIPNRGETFVFKTGDKARKLADGNFDLIGREDRQIKLRGIRVELDAVEYLLCQSAMVRNAVVVKEQAGDTEFLKAFILVRDGIPETEDIYTALRAYMAEQAPDYMIPSDILVVEEFPLLGNGKIDYKALLNIKPHHTIELPVNTTEEKLLQIWKELLGAESISVSDEFLRIGGNSLAIMSLIAKINKEFGIKVALSELFKNMTIRKQAAYILHSSPDDAMNIMPVIEKAYYHTSLTQGRMYYNYMLDKNDRAYNLPMAIEMDESCEVDRLKEVVVSLVKRHESLRTSFKTERGKLVQYIETGINPQITEIFATQEEEGDVLDQFIRPFNLEEAPLFRCAIVHLAKGRRIFVMDVHHIVCDGMSQIILEKDFLRLYKGEILPPLTLQYKDYAEWEFNYRLSDEYRSFRSSWMDVFKGDVPRLRLPSLIDVQEIGNKGSEVVFEMDRALIYAIAEKVGDGEVTISSLLLSFYFIYLAGITGSNDIVIGIASSGRVQYQVEEVVGVFVKTLPVRFTVQASSYYKEWLQSLHQSLIAAFDAQLCDLADIISDLNLAVPTPVTHLFDTMFTFQNFEKSSIFSGNSGFREYHIKSPAPKFPIAIVVTETPDVFSFRMEYASSYFLPADIDMLANMFKDLVLRIAENTGARISEFIAAPVAARQLSVQDISFNF